MKSLLQSSFLGLFLCLLILSCDKSDSSEEPDIVIPSTLPDLSGLSWVADDLFIGVHDAKNNAEKQSWPRISLIRLPQSELDGVMWEPVPLTFPGPGGTSSDMESACSVPGGKDFLFVESGQEGNNYSRIFHAVYQDGGLEITEYADWPVGIINVEATEVCQVGERMVFLYAERAEDSSFTMIRWATLTLDPMDFGNFKEVVYEGIDPVGSGARPIVAMDIDSDGFIYIVSTFDSGDDDGPYRSVIWQIGRVLDDGQGEVAVELGLDIRLADLDGLKVESLAVREAPGIAREIYFGTDDEHYGGILRLLPLTAM
jgi:hypothetical protein